MPHALYYGDNLQVLREHIPDESVDLIYMDPPFNSNASYNVLFKEKTGEESPAPARGRASYQDSVGVRISRS
jgi:site-specific DNA-methyltransferase (adenine-specific)